MINLITCSLNIVSQLIRVYNYKVRILNNYAFNVLISNYKNKTSLKGVLTLLVSVILLFSHTSKIQASDLRLTEGEFIVLGDEPSAEDYYNQFMFWDAVLEIDSKGKVKGYADTSLNDIKLGNNPLSLYNAQISLQMDGEYDEKANHLSGTFASKHSSSQKTEREKPLISSYIDATMVFSGTFSGGYSANDAGFLITFTGNKSYTGKRWSSNGNEEDINESKSWTNKAVFTEDLCGGYSGENLSLKNNLKFIPKIFARDSGARFADFAGQVEVAPVEDREDTRPAEIGMVLKIGDMVETYEDSCAIISFSDMTTLVMKPSSKIILDTLSERESKLSVLAGKIWANAKKAVSEGRLEVTLNQGVSGTKGTTFVAEENGTTSSIKVLEGLMSFTPTGGSDLEVSTGQMASVNKNGEVKTQNFDTTAEEKEWENKNFTDRFADAAPIKNTPATSGPAEPKESAIEERSSNVTQYAIFAVLGLVGLFGVYVYFRKAKV